ncbi:thioredoxin domain-containing protein 17-like [Chironomus tepperi]|uniref:thioredoxin domain-containing protein 17-like n=1 Tax=Chironomus tepperi TaxID=113505 RepID=UPI00391FBBE9
MAEKHTVTGYAAFVDFMKTFSSDKIINILFSGEKVDGKSWCPDCNDADPFIDDALKQFGDNTVFIFVDVGDRTTWKDMKNPFRLDKDTHLSVIPTLIRWKNPQRLEGEQLCKPELLQMFFTEED